LDSELEFEEKAVRHIVVALPEGGSDDFLENLPSVLRSSNWPLATQTADLVSLVHHRLAECPRTIDELLGGDAAASLREALCSEISIPPPRPLPILHYPVPFQASLNRRFVGRAGDFVPHSLRPLNYAGRMCS
jgi:hypothetical protein